MRVQIHMVALAVAATAAFPRPAAAQTTRQLGLSIGYPTALGVLWQPSPRIGIRPELILDFVDSDSTSDFGFGTSRTSSEFWQVGVGISALLFVYREENLSLYVSPHYAHVTGHTTSERQASPGIITNDAEDRENSAHTVAGSLGVRYDLSPRFNVFGEVGLEHHRSKLFDSDFTSRFTRTGIRSGVGVVVFF